MRVPDALRVYQHLMLFNFIFSRGCAVVSDWHCHLHFSSEAENVLMALLDIYITFFMKCRLRPFAHLSYYC